ncbi:MAG: universal stress protein [Desulfobacteraceae bacterium]|jgi:nucleotide-binding universal stress UspA family protein
MEIQKLLFITKFNDLSFNALQSLLCLRDASLNHVVLTNVIEREKVAMHRGLGYQKSEEVRLRETANIRFIDWAENLFEQGIEVGVYIVVGNLVHKVIEAAHKEQTNLIVIGRSHKGFIDQLYSGSDVTEILRQAATPVLVYKPPTDKIDLLDKPFERPLLATDWSPASTQAEEILLPLKGVVQKVNVVHVASEKDLKGSAMEIQKVRKQCRTKLEAIVDRFESNGIEADSHVYIGDPIEEIERAAAECQASMIVMGSSGKSAWTERWLGSTPQTIAEKSEYPTLVTPPIKPGV